MAWVNRSTWTAEEDALIGTMSDRDAGALLGRRASSIWRRREQLGKPIMSDQINSQRIVDGKKCCSACGEWKSVDGFGADRRRSTGRMSACKVCASVRAKSWRRSNPKVAERGQRRNHLKRYGITLEEYEARLEFQDGRCAICGSVETRSGRQHMSVDHDHGTGLVRGLLCQPCNLGLGGFEDDIERLENAIAYLESAKFLKEVSTTSPAT